MRYCATTLRPRSTSTSKCMKVTNSKTVTLDSRKWEASRRKPTRSSTWPKSARPRERCQRRARRGTSESTASAPSAIRRGVPQLCRVRRRSEIWIRLKTLFTMSRIGRRTRPSSKAWMPTSRCIRCSSGIGFLSRVPPKMSSSKPWHSIKHCCPSSIITTWTTGVLRGLRKWRRSEAPPENDGTRIARRYQKIGRVRKRTVTKIVKLSRGWIAPSNTPSTTRLSNRLIYSYRILRRPLMLVLTRHPKQACLALPNLIITFLIRRLRRSAATP